MDYMKIEVGKPLEGVQGRNDGCVFDLSDTGAILYVYYESPSSEEVRNFSAESPLDVRYAVVGGEIFLLFKFGSEEWLDTPYCPQLSKHLTKIPVIPEGDEGLALHIVLADTATGIVDVLRMVGLSNHFSRSFLGAVLERSQKPFIKEVYDMSLAVTYNKYTTRQLVKMAEARSRTGY